MLNRNRLEKLKRIYRRIPTIKCKPGCHACCGPHGWLPVENENIQRFLRKKGIKERKVKSPKDSCPYIEEDKCLIYPVRPVVCRLFGVVKISNNLMKCPHAKPKWYLSEGEADDIFKEVARL